MLHAVERQRAEELDTEDGVETHEEEKEHGDIVNLRTRPPGSKRKNSITLTGIRSITEEWI